ncbi:MAG TPA: citrate/2-methylcitrate synthase, partial [Polyangiaceae bacterium]|nr:citrate/2-methylcitrate synthase [Polyangiaceae bacterium]
MNLEALPIADRPAAKASGLEGVVVADTRLSHVDGERGELVIAGRRAEELAFDEPGHFETVAERLLELAGAEGQPQLRESLAEARGRAFARVPQLVHALSLPDAMDSLLAATAQGSAGMDALSVLGAL